jgi:L-cystine uptake protein TcyP (sodium:dicarboxylate symporter family)
MEREEDRGKSLDGKIASVIAGIVASIGFSLRVNGSAVTYAAAMLYLIPLIALFRAFRTKPLREAPTAESILRYFATFPVSTLKEGCQAMMNAITENRSINDMKTNLFDLGVLFTIVTTIVVLVVQVALAAYKGDFLIVSGRA